jgi:hypothetical protein
MSCEHVTHGSSTHDDASLLHCGISCFSSLLWVGMCQWDGATTLVSACSIMIMQNHKVSELAAHARNHRGLLCVVPSKMPIKPQGCLHCAFIPIVMLTVAADTIIAYIKNVMDVCTHAPCLHHCCARLLTVPSPCSQPTPRPHVQMRCHAAQRRSDS